jgi:hypothetical protein
MPRVAAITNTGPLARAQAVKRKQHPRRQVEHPALAGPHAESAGGAATTEPEADAAVRKTERGLEEQQAASRSLDMINKPKHTKLQIAKQRNAKPLASKDKFRRIAFNTKQSKC